MGPGSSCRSIGAEPVMDVGPQCGACMGILVLALVSVGCAVPYEYSFRRSAPGLQAAIWPAVRVDVVR